MIVRRRKHEGRTNAAFDAATDRAGADDGQYFECEHDVGCTAKAEWMSEAGLWFCEEHAK